MLRVSSSSWAAAQMLGKAMGELAAQIRESLPPLFDLVTPMPYVELQKLLDEANARGIHGYEKAPTSGNCPTRSST
jgi:hypothetical protein